MNGKEVERRIEQGNWKFLYEAGRKAYFYLTQYTAESWSFCPSGLCDFYPNAAAKQRLVQLSKNHQVTFYVLVQDDTEFDDYLAAVLRHKDFLPSISRLFDRALIGVFQNKIPNSEYIIDLTNEFKVV